MKEIKNIVLNIPHSSMNKYNEGWDIKDAEKITIKTVKQL